MNAPKKYLGGITVLGGRQRVYELADALEVNEYGPFEIRRTRVFLDEVLALTYRRHKGVFFLLFTALGFVSMAIVSAMFLALHWTAGLVTFLLLSAPFLVALVLRMTLGLDEITVYGRRTSARLSFWLKKDDARKTFEYLKGRIRRYQDSIKPAAPPGPPLPAPDSPPEPPPPPPASGS